jgi:hypothetical protein
MPCRPAYQIVPTEDSEIYTVAAGDSGLGQWGIAGLKSSVWREESKVKAQKCILLNMPVFTTAAASLIAGRAPGEFVLSGKNVAS